MLILGAGDLGAFPQENLENLASGDWIWRHFRWRPRNGCDGRLMVKILITLIQVNLVLFGLGTKFTWIVVIKIFTINLPSQPFLGCHLGFHIFFHLSLFEGCTLFLQLGCFGLNFTSFCICIHQSQSLGLFNLQFFSLPQEEEKMRQGDCFVTKLSTRWSF